MKADDPYQPGVGTPPPELAGRDDILQDAKNMIARAKNGAAKSLMLLGLRGMGKTVLLNEIEKIAKDAKCETGMFEASARKSLAKEIVPKLHELLLQLYPGKKVSKVSKAIGYSKISPPSLMPFESKLGL